MSRENLHRRGDPKGRNTMRGKLIEKQKAADEHESNFAAGRVNVRERYLHRTGIRGRKSWIFCCVLFILLFIVVINLVMCIIMYTVLQLSADGMKCLSFFEETGKLRWMCLSDLEAVTLYKGQMGTFKDQNMIFESDNKKVVFHGGPTTTSAQIHIGAEQSEIRARSGFRFVEPYEKKTILNLNGSVWNVQQEYVTASQVAAEALITHRVVSNENQNLTLRSGKKAEVSGNEGIYLDGKTLTLNVEKNVTMSSKTKIVFDAKEGVHLSGRVPESPAGGSVSLKQRYKLCACATGDLFRVQVNGTHSSCQTVQKMC